MANRKEYMAKYYLKNRNKVIERQKKYNKDNSEKINEYSKQHYASNPDYYKNRPREEAIFKYKVKKRYTIKFLNDLKKYLETFNYRFIEIEKIIKEFNKQEIYHEGHRLNRSKRLKYSYGINLHTYYKILLLNKNRCFVCQKETPTEFGTFHIDKSENKIRGIVCYSCKSAIKFFKNDIKLISKAIECLRTA